MRIRFKPWARPELEASKFYIDNPEEWKGKWKEFFKNSNIFSRRTKKQQKPSNRLCCKRALLMFFICRKKPENQHFL